MANIEKIINHISGYDDNQLSQLFQNALKQDSQDSKAVIAAIEQEWRVRKAKALKGKYKADRPETGLLGFLGYHVGIKGEVPEKRRKILTFVIESDALPFVQSPAYMDEWGEPNARKRIGKIISTIEFFIRENQNFSGMEKAIIEWKEDLDFVRANYLKN